MKKAVLLLMLLASFCAKAQQILNPSIDAIEQNGTRIQVVIRWHCGQPSEMFTHYDTTMSFLNAWPGHAARVFGPGTNVDTLMFTGLTQNVEYHLRATIRSATDTVVVIASMQTSSAMRLGGLVGRANSPTDVQLTCYFMNRASLGTIAYLNASDSSLIAVSDSLDHPWIGADTIHTIQQPNTTVWRYCVGWNISNPDPIDWSRTDSFAITTDPLPPSDPYIDTLTVYSVTHDSLSYHVHGLTDVVSAWGYFQVSNDNWANFATVNADYIPAGYFSIDARVKHEGIPGSTLRYRYLILNNLGGTQHTDTVWDSVAIPNIPPPPPTPENLVPNPYFVDHPNLDIHARVEPIHVTDPFGALAALHCVRASDPNGTTWSTSGQLNPGDSTFQRVFHGIPGECYFMRTLVVENGILRESQYSEFIAQYPNQCFTTSGIDDYEEDWDGAQHELDAAYFEKRGGADVMVTNVLGQQTEFKHFASWSEMFNYLKPGISFVTTLPHKRTNAVWSVTIPKFDK